MTDDKNKRFWGRYAKLYDFEINRFNKAAYQQMYQMMSAVLTADMEVLELATSTGLIARNIAGSVKRICATDFSPGMIATAEKKAKKKACPTNVTFSVEDATALSFADASFDAVIISNALHIMPNPALALANIWRVLKPGGLFIAPSFMHGHIKESTWDANARFLRFIGLETYAKWSPEEYIDFIANNGFLVDRWKLLQAAFPLVYLEAHMSEHTLEKQNA